MFPTRALGEELFPTIIGELVLSHSLPFLRLGPLGLDPPLARQAVERRVERACIYLECVLGRRANNLREAITVAGTPTQRLKDDDIERALKQFDAGQRLPLLRRLFVPRGVERLHLRV